MSDTSIQFVRAIPIVPAGENLEAALDFYEQKLGFERTWLGGGFAGLRFGDVHIMLQQFGNQQFCSNYMYRIEIKGLDAYYAQLRQRSVHKLGKLEVKPWGTYEFHLLDPAGVLIAFFEANAE